MDLTFARRAHELGCPYVEMTSDGVPWCRLIAMRPDVSVMNICQRFAFGATIALWARNEAHRRARASLKDRSIAKQGWGEFHTIADQAERFAVEGK